MRVSTTIAEVEPGAVHAPGTDLTPYAVPAVEEYRPRIVMQPEEAKALDDKLRECMRAILKEDIDFGTIPGAGDKKNLLKPGAEKLLQWFGFGSRSREVKIERDDPETPSGIADKARRIGVTYRTEITKTIPGFGEVIVATCEGYAGYDEDRYYVAAGEARAKAEARERANAVRYERQANPSKWENATEYRAPWNTLIKMAQKRSYVGAAIDATGAAGLFTQDMEDMRDAGPSASTWAASAEAAVRGLPDSARAELVKWYRTRRWPEPARWTPEQWCEALVEAGTLKGHAAGTADRQPDGATEPATDADWLARALARVPGLGTLGECRGVWAESTSMIAAGQCTQDEAAPLRVALRARMEELRNAEQAKAAGTPEEPAGTPAGEVPDDDPWMIKICDIATAADAERVADEMLREFGDTPMADERLTRLRNALVDRSTEVADVLVGKVA